VDRRIKSDRITRLHCRITASHAPHALAQRSRPRCRRDRRRCFPPGRVNGANAARPLTHLLPLYAACLPPDLRTPRTSQPSALMRCGGGAHDGAARKTPEPKRRNRTAASFSRQVSRRGLESSRKCSQALGRLRGLEAARPDRRELI